MWLTDMQSELKPTKLPRTKADQNQYWLRCTEIGVGLTSFGALFMMLGIMLFFDGALLALGNVRTSFSPLSLPQFLIVTDHHSPHHA